MESLDTISDKFTACWNKGIVVWCLSQRRNNSTTMLLERIVPLEVLRTPHRYFKLTTLYFIQKKHGF